MTTHRIIHGDVMHGITLIPDASVHEVVTSIPYLWQRDYGEAGQIGLEESPEEYIEKIVSVSREIFRILRPDGVYFMNTGNSYAGSGKGPTGINGIGDQGNRQGFRTNGLREVLERIADIGYDAEWYTLRASGFGAPHERKRTFIVAHTKRYEQSPQESCYWPIRRVGGSKQPIPWNRTCESALCEFRGMDDGTTYGVDRTDTIRNSVVPQQVYPILKAIAEIEMKAKP